MIDRLLIDTGPLVAFLNRRDRYHSWVKQQLAAARPPLLTCEAVISETCFLVDRRGGRSSTVIDLVERGLIETSFDLVREAPRVREIMTRYSNVPASFADACLVRMAEIQTGSRLLTFDSDFLIYRIHSRKVLPTLLPAGKSPQRD